MLIRSILAKFQTKCAVYTGWFESYLGRVLRKMRLIFPRLNGPIDSLVVSALQDTGGYAISRQNNIELHLGCYTC